MFISIDIGKPLTILYGSLQERDRCICYIFACVSSYCWCC